MALVDDEDHGLVTSVKEVWFVHKYGHAQASIWGDGKTHGILMHRLIMNAPVGMDVDHINGNRLDNRKINLRICTRAQNRKNCRSRGGSSRFKGVTWDKSKKRWTAQIQSDKKHYLIGRFKKENEAARAYDVAALVLHGEFACLNFGSAK